MNSSQQITVMGPSRDRGFTLIELMITVVVIAILSAIAYPSYMDSVRKSRRADGKAFLTDAAAREERFFALYNTYTSVIVAPGGLGYSNATSPGGYYTLTVGLAGGGYTLTATAVGSQTQDTANGTACTPLTLNSLGVKTPAVCW
jgi:type IV pilus assembly protein PilE